MKKILLFISLLILPIVVCAEEEVEYKWYTIKENNIHYESDVENNCGYFDKEDYIYSEYFYSMDEPIDIDDRVIEKINSELSVSRTFFNKLMISQFLIHYKDEIKITELNFANNNDENLAFTIDIDEPNKLTDGSDDTYIILKNITSIPVSFNNAIDVRDFKIIIKYIKPSNYFNGIAFSLKLTDEINLNSFYSYNEIVNENCNEDLCTLEVKINYDNMYNEDISFNTIIYRYRDIMYKCYDLERIYVPGYYKELDGFIKDEEKYRIVETEVVEIPVEIYNVDEEVNTLDNAVQDEYKESILETSNTTVAMVDDKIEETSDNYYILTALLIIVLIVGTFLIIKNIKKSRTK